MCPTASAFSQHGTITGKPPASGHNHGEPGGSRLSLAAQLKISNESNQWGPSFIWSIWFGPFSSAKVQHCIKASVVTQADKKKDKRQWDFPKTLNRVTAHGCRRHKAAIVALCGLGEQSVAHVHEPWKKRWIVASLSCDKTHPAHLHNSSQMNFQVRRWGSLN